VVLLLAGGVISATAAGKAAPDSATQFAQTVTPLLQKYCYQCHGNGKHSGKLALDNYKTIADVETNRVRWEDVLRTVRAAEMPPPNDTKVQPTLAEREAITSWIEKELYQFDPAHPDPGKVTLRRLNRAEYNATIRDLVGVDFKPAEDFPPDDSGYGFDNIGDVLSLPPILLEKYLAAADKILDQAIVTDPIKPMVRHFPASTMQIGFNALGDRGDGWVQLISLEEDDVAVPLDVPPGDYLVRIQAFSTKDGGALIGQGSEGKVTSTNDPGPTKIGIMLNDSFIKDFAVTRDEHQPGTYEARVGVPAGKNYFRASVRRKRGGSTNELFMLNGRIGGQQPGIVLVKWMEIEGPLPAATRRFLPDKLQVVGEKTVTPSGDIKLLKNGEVATTIDLAKDSEVILRAQAFAQQAGNETTKMEFRIDGKPVKTFDVIAPATMQPLPSQRVFSLTLLVPQPFVYEIHANLPAGKHRFAAAFVNNFADPTNKNPNLRVRSLTIQNLEASVLGVPVLIPPMPAPVRELFAKHPLPPAGMPAAGASPEDAARGIVADFTHRAWRGPVDPADIDRLMKLYEFARAQGDSFEAGVKLVMKAVLVSPHFLFLGELPERRPPARLNAKIESQPAVPEAGAPRPLDEVALASRLSYFLWSSMPDDELLGLAERGQLRKNLTAQVKRMLASPKASALTENFAGQWLQIRTLGDFQPDKKMFPDYDPALSSAMQRETEMFFENVMRKDTSVFDFLTGDYTFVNARLAKFYGMTNAAVTGEEFERVSLAKTPRRGVLTQGSVLALTSNPTRTSPVKRGKWVLENLLGTPPPPPPPDVPNLDDKSRQLTGTLRQQMEQHRVDPNCAGCHARMDPIGFGLENFDAIGAWRDKEGTNSIDASGRLVSGDSFAGAGQLATVLATKHRQEFLNCLADKMLTYALGRGTEYYDRPALEKITQAMDKHQDKFSSLILAVTDSFPFQMRRGAPAQTASLTPAGGPSSGLRSPEITAIFYQPSKP
jgi:mono/diheme cytochrome c family protein